MKKVISVILFVLLVLIVLALSYGISILLCGLGLWALCKLGVIATWTWGRAVLWAIIIEVAIVFLRAIFSGKKNND